MITLTARIDLISGNNGTLSSVLSEISKNRISSEIGAILGSKSQGSNPFMLGVSKFGEGATFSDSVDYFIGGQLSNDKGEFETPCVLTLNGSEITSLTIAFDTVNNRHPNTIKIDGVDYADDDAIFTVTNLPRANTHTITIDNWNLSNCPIIITGIYVNISIDINYRNLISLTSTLFDRSDYSLPSYGIISNTGSMEFNDLNGEIKDYAEQLLLTSDLKVGITLKDTLTNKEEQIALMETVDWDYDNNNRSVSVSLQDDLVEWQNIYVKGFDFDPRNPLKILPNGTMEDLYKNLLYAVPSKYKLLKFGELDIITQNILASTKIEYPLLKDGTLWEQFVKLCEVCGLYIYKNKDGKTVCSYTYGS